ncbi:MAG TPA: helix-hairpin-helix domain-containing protein, partial [Acidobacteriota bacterium]|nr:helix-hairpin-helix domain-containing protein [Acidobacteriota bacterium]
GWKLDIIGEGEKKKEAEEQMARLADGTLTFSDEMELVETEEFAEGGSVTELPGIGPKTAERLKEAGIETIEQLSEMSIEEIAEIPGLGKKTAEKILKSLNEEE